MGIDLGQAIKINRLKSNMTQSELANGIISISYLSKIENGTAEPPKEIIQLLGEKLQINLLDSEELITDQTIINWFYHLLHSNFDESIRLYNKIKNNLSSVIDKKMLSLIEIHKLHYSILISDMEEANKLIFSLKKSSKRFTEAEMYYYLKFVGNYHFEKLSFKRALECYQDAEEYIKSDLFHHLEEVNHLYYLISSAASKSRQPHLSLIYSIKALEYYQSNYDLKKCAECHILQGISYQRIKDFQNAKKSYKYAINITEKLGNVATMQLCYQNIGSLSSEANEHSDAIIFFLKSYELRKEDKIARRIVPVSSLMKEYYNLGDIVNSKMWLELGLDLVKSLPPTKSIYIYEFRVYQYLINGTDTSFELFMVDEVLPFLEEKQLYYEKALYLKLLAKYYRENRKYKLSSNYFEEAYYTLVKLSNN